MQIWSWIKIRAFIYLLRDVARNGFFFATEELMREFHRVASMWAPELVITRRTENGTEILLAVYGDGVKEFRGLWHIPGGYNRWDEPDIATTCSRVAKRELGTDVIYGWVLDAYKWKTGEHPYGHPLSLYVECRENMEIEVNEKRRFFPIDNLPVKLVSPHRRFIESKLLGR